MTLDRLDPLQFAFQAGEGTTGGMLFILDRLSKRLERSISNARVLFLEFLILALPFKKVLPHILLQKVSLVLCSLIRFKIFNFVFKKETAGLCCLSSAF